MDISRLLFKKSTEEMKIPVYKKQTEIIFIPSSNLLWDTLIYTQPNWCIRTTLWLLFDKGLPAPRDQVNKPRDQIWRLKPARKRK